MGLLRALERFDPERGVPVWGYAVLFPSGARFVRPNEEERHCTGEVDRQQCVTRPRRYTLRPLPCASEWRFRTLPSSLTMVVQAPRIARNRSSVWSADSV